MRGRSLAHRGQCITLPRQPGNDTDGHQYEEKHYGAADYQQPGGSRLFDFSRRSFELLRHAASCCGSLEWITVNIKGTKNKVAKVATVRPPMTARARGAFCSPPSPMPSAMGSMPMIMAKAVMMMGRSRV